MKVNKIKTHELEKCYAISPLTYNGAEHILIAAEKVNKCLLFDLDGNLEETVWDEPGGTMSMVQVPEATDSSLPLTNFIPRTIPRKRRSFWLPRRQKMTGK